tara:strand:- start:816 stop:1061 length:246 start_codon:yes stop_codon:yes gene_type:complete
LAITEKCAAETAINTLFPHYSMSVREMIQDMINELTEAIGDAEKHDSGNSAAGTRVRKVMQACKGLAQDVRVKVQGDKNSR